MIRLSLDKNNKYLLACSFGPDSMALFNMLLKGDYNFECAIVNYHLRKESDLEVKGLLDYASKNGVKVHLYDCKETPNRNIESKCREIRYNFFKSLFESGEYDALLIAHNEDDHLETYLMQKKRQNSPIYFGINEKTVIKGMEVIRPLLAYKKSELKEYCDKNNVPYAIDKSNFDVSILRNKIRHQVIAKMSESDRKDLLEEINEENAKLNRVISSIELAKIHEVDYLLSLDELSLKYALNILAKYIDEKCFISNANVGEIKKALLSSKPNISFRIKIGLYFYKEYGYVDITNKGDYRISYSYYLSKPGELDTPYFYLNFTGDTSNRNVRESDYPLQIRNIVPTDYILINGYRVSVLRLFIDWKMPLRLRYRWPIIVDNNDKPVYIPRYRKDFKPKKNENFIVKI